MDKIKLRSSADIVEGEAKQHLELKTETMLLITGLSGLAVSVSALVALQMMAKVNSAVRGSVLEQSLNYSPVAVSLAVVVAALSIVVLVILIVNRAEEEDKDDPASFHGTARFAGSDELEKFRVLTKDFVTPGSVVLGPEGEGEAGLMVVPRALSVQHGLILGSTGTGKTRAYVMPNCAWVPETSLVVTDIKYELWKYTSGFHQRAQRYAPLDPEASAGFNWIPLCTTVRTAQICARAILEAGHRTTDSTSSFFIDNEVMFLSALFAHAATLEEPTPLSAYRLFTRQRPDELKKQLLNSQSEIAQEQALMFYEMTDPRIKGGIVPAMAAKMQWLRDEDVARFTSAEVEAPRFGEIRRQPTAVYYCLPEQDIARLRPLTSLFFTLLLEQIAGEKVAEGAATIPITMMLDEFANVGVIPDFDAIISLARGRGVAIWIVLQSLAQLEERYGKARAQTIITNCVTKVALHGLDVDSAAYVSRMLGESTVVVNRKSKGVGSDGSTTATYSRSEHQRPLMTADEVMRLKENEALVRIGNYHPMKLKKLWYDAEPKAATAKALGAAQVAVTEVAVAPGLGDPPKLPEALQQEPPQLPELPGRM